MLKQADREADAQTAPEIWRLNPRTAPRGGRHGDAVPRLEYDSDLLATLLAMAAHDLRQPLQVITGAQTFSPGCCTGIVYGSYWPGRRTPRRGWA